MKLGKYYKIGRTNDPVEKRKYEIGLKFPENPKTIHEIKTDDPIGIEAYWHKRFENKNVRDKTEWFDLSSSDVKAFKRWKRIW
ncbi:MAG: GIY-YIG nuclease family protein [Sedimentisphaerales bacterium]|nr:GIY-YIG nuclease family protein [Sedimentisphaerales bacterium]